MPHKLLDQSDCTPLKKLYEHVNTEVPNRVKEQNKELEQVIVPLFPGSPPDKIPIAYFPAKRIQPADSAAPK